MNIIKLQAPALTLGGILLGLAVMFAFVSSKLWVG